jgi:hypothetical protein
LEREVFSNRLNDRDGTFTDNRGADNFTDSEGNENIFYSKIDVLDKLLDLYDELKILSIVSRLGKSKDIDYSQIHRFLHNGIFLENNAVYIDHVSLPRSEVHYDRSDIITMYCYIVTEVKHQLDEEFSSEVKFFSENFQHKYMGIRYSLFDEEHYSQVIDILKKSLEIIDRHTQIKDPDYWDFYNAIESFLFGDLNWRQDGEIWGISNFHSVWESICLTVLVKNTPAEFFLYIDPRSIVSIETRDLTNQKYKISFIEIKDIFHVNGSKIYPDFIHINTNYPVYSNCKFDGLEIRKASWDDYGYKTQIYSQLKTEKETKSRWMKVAFEGQEIGVFTFDMYDSWKLEGKEYYSFWDFEEEELIPEDLWLMKEYNHLFYIAITKKLFTPKDFSNYFQQKSDILFTSLLRNICYGRDLKPLYERFLEFINKFYIQIFYIKIIDVKYNDFNYFKNDDNKDEIKRKSLRKQFIYEYLIQKHIERHPAYGNIEIKSEFWLPVYLENSTELFSFVEDVVYLDGYIKLKGVNIIPLIKEYLKVE